jgi:hypothetical protein
LRIQTRLRLAARRRPTIPTAARTKDATVRPPLPSAGAPARGAATHAGTLAQAEELLRKPGMKSGMQLGLVLRLPRHDSRQAGRVDSPKHVVTPLQLQTQHPTSNTTWARDCPTRLSSASASVTAAIPLQARTRTVDSLAIAPLAYHGSREESTPFCS